MQLSRNFSLQELIKSDTAIRKGIDNNPNADQIEKLNYFVKIFYNPYVITSAGLRLPADTGPQICVKPSAAQ